MIHTYPATSHSEASVRLLHPRAPIIRPCPIAEKNGVRKPTWFVFDNVVEAVGHWTAKGGVHVIG